MNKITFIYVNWGACVYVELSTQSRALQKVLTVCQHVKIFPASMKPACLLPSHQYFLPRVRYSALTVFILRSVEYCFNFYLDLQSYRFSWNFPSLTVTFMPHFRLSQRWRYIHHILWCDVMLSGGKLLQCGSECTASPPRRHYNICSWSVYAW